MQQRNKGTALISTLLIVAVVAMIATAFALRGQRLIDHAIWGARTDRILLALQGAQDWGIAEILHSPLTSEGVQVSPRARKMGTLHYHGITVTASILDQQGLFNINALASIKNVKQVMRFISLVRAVDSSISARHADNIARAITGKLIAEKNTSHQMTDITELRAIPGMTAKLYRELKPYITAIPATSLPININTAPVPVIMGLMMRITSAQGQRLVDCVKRQGLFRTIQEYNTVCLQGSWFLDSSTITTSSRYFIVTAQAKSGPQERVLRLFLQVATINKTPKIIVLWRTIT